MFPWVYEFRWSAYHLVFLGVFFTAIGVIVVSVGRAFRRSSSLVREGRLSSVRWHAAFTDLPNSAKRCRHEMTGEVRKRVCPHAFECGSCELHPVLVGRSRGRADGTGTGPVIVGGIRIPLDRMYHRGHAWYKEGEDGTATIGPDPFIARILGPADSVSLPEPGARLERNGVACTLTRGGRQYSVLSPSSGGVIDAGNGEVGWWIRLRPDPGPDATAHLLRGPEVWPWLVGELERVERAVATGGAAATLADGGELLPGLGGLYDEEVMDGVLSGLLLND